MGKRILVIDDEKIICIGLSKLLEREGYKAEYSLNGAEAVNRTKNNGYDMVIADIVLPDIKGGEVCKKFVEVNPNIKIIIMSGHYELLEAQENKNTNPVNFLQFVHKPFDDTTILQAISTAFGKNM